MTVLKMKSLEPMTPYAPSWDFSFGVYKWLEQDKIEKIKSWILSNEQRFISSYSGDYDGGTGLGLDSVTGGFAQYNLFKFSKELPELDDLLNFVRTSYIQFVNEDNTPAIESEIVCWFNVMRAGQQVKEHTHGAGNDVYLSANLILDDYPTKTNYRCPFDRDLILPIDNNTGILTIFPSCIPHYSDTFVNGGERISIAMDIRILGILESKERQAIPFLNNEILENDLHFS